MTKKELIDLLKDYLTVDIKNHDSYCYGGGYKRTMSIVIEFDGEHIYESSTFEVGDSS